VNDLAQWLTLTISKAPLNTPINEIILSEKFVGEDLMNKLKLAYKSSQFYNENSYAIESVINSSKSLSSININSIEYCLKFLDICPKRFLSSEMNIFEADANLRLIRMCQELNCDVYLSGVGGKNYMDLELFKKEGIEVRFQEFKPSAYIYQQRGLNFIEGLSVIDVLFNAGGEMLNELLISQIK
jgi:hypothetical protein